MDLVSQFTGGVPLQGAMCASVLSFRGQFRSALVASLEAGRLATQVTMPRSAAFGKFSDLFPACFCGKNTTWTHKGGFGEEDEPFLQTGVGVVLEEARHCATGF